MAIGAIIVTLAWTCIYNSHLRYPYSFCHSFLLERLCPKYLRASTVQKISEGFLFCCIAAAAFGSSTCIPVLDYCFDSSDDATMFSKIVHYGITTFGYSCLSLIGWSLTDLKMIRSETERFSRKMRSHTHCAICQTESEPSQSLCCSQKHPIHRRCLDSLIRHQCTEVLAVPSKSSLISCPTCKAIFDHEQLTKGGGGASKQALALLEKVVKADFALRNLGAEEQVAAGNKDCYMCPKCNFGPVAHIACSNLMSHHGSKGISNKCPVCSFLSASISDWKKWHGGVGSSSSALKAAPLQKDIPNSNEAMIMDFCAVTLEVARDMLRRERNVQVAITNWVSGL